jgi:hypothetical protein
LAGLTEEQWLRWPEPERLLECLESRAKPSDRKLRLFALACCRSVQALIEDQRAKEAIALLEQVAEGIAGKSKLRTARSWFAGLALQPDLGAAWHDAMAAFHSAIQPRAWNAARDAARFASWALARAAIRDDSAVPSRQRVETRRKFEVVHAGWVRCIFANPFREPVAPHSLPITLTVSALAGSIYSDGAFERLPILADALEEAGSTDTDVLSHCRGPGPHVLGCSVVDLILGRM